ncbi:MAG: hypothetical protein H7328_10805 [Bdellovibrio sp.]|nr:hypothetical protein [Bdellovibrio sp.]
MKQSKVSRTVDVGTMNEKDAKIPGYTDKNGHAVSNAKKDIPGHPTGALTDIGAGRSSVVRTEKEKDKTQTIEKAPKPRGEQAP